MRNGYYARVFHADDHTVGQTYFHLYRKYKDEKMIKPTINQFDFILYHPSKTKMDWIIKTDGIGVMHYSCLHHFGLWYQI